MKYTIERTSQFKKDFKLAEKQGLDMNELKAVVNMLQMEKRFRKSIMIMD